MKRVIIDFDNTMGVPGCDVDDGLALLYLLGCDDVEVEAVCTTYGNSRIDVVDENTRRILDAWGLGLPVARGAGSPMSQEPDCRAAAELIARKLIDAPDEVHLLGIGSTTNLGLADRIVDGSLGKAASITLMGGVTESLVINGRIMDELNLSCDPDATARVLQSGAPLTIATAQACLPAFFMRRDLIEVFGETSWFCETCDDWFKTMNAKYDWDGWTCWDVVAAAALAHPELFEHHRHDVTVYERFLSVGYLECDEVSVEQGIAIAAVDIPAIKDIPAFRDHVKETWARAASRVAVS